MQLTIFRYEEENQLNNLTTVEIDGQVWFVASDVCKLLEIQNVSQALGALDEDEKLPYVIHRSGQRRSINIVNESGLYQLIFRSKKESAKKFRKWVTSEVIPSIRKTGIYGIDRSVTPNFVIRYNENWARVDKSYFSVISELFVRLYGKFHHLGYQIPNRALDGKEIRPDVSVGRLFAIFLDQYHPHLSADYKMYTHRFPDGTEVDARQYPNETLPVFIKFIDHVWIPEHAERYFRTRDLKALDYLPLLLKAS